MLCTGLLTKSAVFYHLSKATIVSFLILASINSNSQTKHAFTLKGEIPASVTASIYISYSSNTHRYDSIKTIQGNFTYSGEITEPTLITLKCKNYSTSFFAETGTTYIKVADTSFSEWEIRGSPIQDDMVSRRKRMNYLLAKELNSGKSELQLTFEADTSFINSNPASFVSLYFLNFRFSELSSTYVADRFKNIEKKYQQTSIGKKLNKKLALSKRSLPGSKLKNSKFYNENGMVTSIKDLSKKHKLLLIDFWASWCAPCRSNVPFLKSLYSKNKSKGLGILSLSIDKKKEDWLKTVQKDSIQIWYNGIELYYGQGEKLYGITQIPAYILINNKGIIIGKYNGRWKGKEDMEEAISRLLE